MEPSADDLKRRAAGRAVEAVRSGMVVGLGTGSTAVHATHLLAELLRTGALARVLGVATSERTAQVAREAGVPLTTLEEHPVVDLAIDGADEVDPRVDLIKGLGGALLREKIVAAAAREFVVVVDHSKRVERLGTRAPVPVEVVRFGWSATLGRLQALGARASLRKDPAGTAPFLSDEGHYILDCRFGPIPDPVGLALAIRACPGVVEHGLFLGMAARAIVATPGGIQEMRR